MKLSKSTVCLLALTASAGVTFANTVTLPPSQDTYTRPNHGASTSTSLEIYGAGGNDFFSYIRFDLSSLPAGATIDSATLTAYYCVPYSTAHHDTLVPSRFACYGLLDVSGNTSQTWDGATLSDGASLNIGQEYGAGTYSQLSTTDLSNNWLYNLDVGNGANVTVNVNGSAGLTSTDGDPVTLSGSDLVTFLNGQLADASQQATIISAINAENKSYYLYSSDTSTASLRPSLTISYTPVPEPTTLALIGLGALGFAAGRRRKA